MCVLAFLIVNPFTLAHSSSTGILYGFNPCSLQDANASLCVLAASAPVHYVLRLQEVITSLVVIRILVQGLL